MKYLKTFALLLLSATMLIGCRKDDNSNDIQTPTEETLSVSPTNLSFDYSGGHQAITVSSSMYWWVTCSDRSWCSTNVSSGDGDVAQEVLVTVSPNSSSASRSATITVENDAGLSQTVQISQSGGNGGGNNSNLSVSPTSLSFSSSTGSKSVTITSNSSWTISCNATWCSVNQSSGSGNSTVSVSVNANSSTQSRSTVISVSSGSTTKNINVTQEGSSGGSTVPSAVTGLHAQQQGNSIVISWNAATNAYVYRLYYIAPAPYDIETFENIYAPNTSCTFSNNLHNGTYTFWILASNSSYENGPTSSRVTCTYSSGGGGGGNTQVQLSTPTNLEAYSGGSYVQVSCDKVSNAYSYELYRSSSASYGYSKISASGGESGSRYVLTDQNPRSGTTYYKIKAIGYTGNGYTFLDSEMSNYVSVTR